METLFATGLWSHQSSQAISMPDKKTLKIKYLRYFSNWCECDTLEQTFAALSVMRQRPQKVSDS